MTKQYLTAIHLVRKDRSIVPLFIGYYPDTPNKNLRIYYNGSDTGCRYEHLGNASREIKRVLDAWIEIGIDPADIVEHYETKAEFYEREGVFYD